MTHKQLLGRAGENFVAEHLVHQGFLILDRNWRIREGEIDLVVLDPTGTIRFIEVKTRTSQKFGHPLEAIDPTKALRLQRLALAWLSTHQRLGAHYQIDCAAVNAADAKNLALDYRSGIL